MSRFANARDAKEFLVAQIVEQAEREGVSLSDVERKMLYFSETGWTPPDMAGVNVEFASRCDQEEYERKISQLVRQARQSARVRAAERKAWSEAIRVLAKEDHYLLVMVEQAEPLRPRFDFLKLVATPW